MIHRTSARIGAQEMHFETGRLALLADGAVYLCDMDETAFTRLAEAYAAINDVNLRLSSTLVPPGKLEGSMKAASTLEILFCYCSMPRSCCL